MESLFLRDDKIFPLCRFYNCIISFYISSHFFIIHFLSSVSNSLLTCSSSLISYCLCLEYIQPQVELLEFEMGNAILTSSYVGVDDESGYPDAPSRYDGIQRRGS